MGSLICGDGDVWRVGGRCVLNIFVVGFGFSLLLIGGWLR